MSQLTTTVTEKIPNRNQVSPELVTLTATLINNVTVGLQVLQLCLLLYHATDLHTALSIGIFKLVI